MSVNLQYRAVGITPSSVKFILDPCGEWITEESEYTPMWCIMACGLIPRFVVDGNHGAEDTLKEQLEIGYAQSSGCPFLRPMHVTVNRDGVLMGDMDEDDLHPYGLLECERGKVYIYPYGIVCIRVEGEPDLITRMD